MKGKGKKEQLLESAMSLILKKGYSHTSVEDITNNVGIAKGSFYTYFKSKNLLLMSIIDSKINDLAENHRNQLKSSKSFEELMWKNINSRVRFSGEDLKRELVLINLIRNIDGLGREIRELLIKLEEGNRDFVEKIIETYGEELNIDMKNKKRYARMFNAIIRDFKMSKIFTSRDGDNGFFISDVAIAEKRMEEKDFQEGIEFIYQTILKVLK